MVNFNQEQHTAEWHRSRLGRITGSRVGALMKSGRSKSDLFSATAKTYLFQLAGERMLNPEIVNDDQMLFFFLDQTTSQSKAMRFGSEQEDNARNMYVETTGHDVRQVGLCPHNRIPTFASSPDGVTADNDDLGCIEIKCPSIGTFAQYAAEIKDNTSLLNINPDYYYQCQSHMACTDSAFCDFVIYCPFVESPLHVVRIKRDDDAIQKIEERVSLAEKYIQDIINKTQN